MSFPSQLREVKFFNKYIQESLDTLSQTTVRRRELGIPRWDRFMEVYPFSGIVVMPVRLNGFLLDNPFYWAVEKVYEHERLFVKQVEGDPYSLGDVFGFFGMYDFVNFNPRDPIFLVEGPADWSAVKPYYRWVLSVNKASLSFKHLYYLSNITDKLVVGFDMDSAGSTGVKNVLKRSIPMGLRIKLMQAPDGDWGAMVESEYGLELLERRMEKLQALKF